MQGKTDRCAERKQKHRRCAEDTEERRRLEKEADRMEQDGNALPSKTAGTLENLHAHISSLIIAIHSFIDGGYSSPVSVLC